ncbi:MAG: Lrp/AsnC ligand binding domain-containing protein [Candidatus Heimdallarchaeota archaeon]|nr:Lrp/AsnC ligand binding domain-containing protein [Candidatus Heimdallarchaeota archaeon]
MTTEAYILLNIVLGKEKELLEQLKLLEETKECWIVMGSFDIICHVLVDSAKELRPLVTNKIRALDGVRQSMTVIVV